MPFMYFMVKTIKGQNRFRCENVITASYHLLYKDTKKWGVASKQVLPCIFVCNSLYYKKLEIVSSVNLPKIHRATSRQSVLIV